MENLLVTKVIYRWLKHTHVLSTNFEKNVLYTKIKISDSNVITICHIPQSRSRKYSTCKFILVHNTFSSKIAVNTCVCLTINILYFVSESTIQDNQNV